MSHFPPHSGVKCDILRRAATKLGCGRKIVRIAEGNATSYVEAESATPSFEQHSQALGDLVGFLFEAPGSDADRVDPGQLKILNAERIALESSTGAVGLVSVQFDGEALSLPVGVDLVSGDECVDRGPG